MLEKAAIARSPAVFESIIARIGYANDRDNAIPLNTTVHPRIPEHCLLDIKTAPRIITDRPPRKHSPKMMISIQTIISEERRSFKLIVTHFVQIQDQPSRLQSLYQKTF